jgi:sec-independent protein translocase protein TatA
LPGIREKIMGFGIKELIIIFAIVALLFGTKKIKSVGSDVGGWIRDFRKAMKDDPEGSKDKEKTERVIDVQPETDKEKV